MLSCIILSSRELQAQTVIDSVADRISWYGLQKPSSTLFVHFDKTIYTNNENVWFTGYLLKSRTKDSHLTLSVALIRNDDRSILAEGKYLFNDLVAFGNLFLPDSMPTGDYTFICHTNLITDGEPAALFIQPITIKSANSAGFVANLSLIDSISPGMDSANILLQAYAQDKLLKGAAVTYFIGNKMQPLITGKLKTNNFGEANISVPLKQITPANNILHAEINNGKEIKTFSIKLPVYKKESIVKFYPEGGSMVAGAQNTIGWEVKNNEGEQLFVQGVLYENDKPLQSIQTNIYGIGRFSFTPIKSRRYHVKLNSNEQAGNNIYLLPDAIEDAPVINIEKALTDDTLIVHFKNQQPGSEWQLMIHNYRETFLIAPLSSKRNSLTVKIPLNIVPAGINTLTVLDTIGRPWAERLFFAHFNQKSNIKIGTDSNSYSTRQKVILKFKITDQQQNPLRGVVSVACAQDNRFDINKMTDIESYSYLLAEMEALPFKTKMMSSEKENKEYLENLLLVKGWRKYNWLDLAKVKASDTLKNDASLVVTGSVFMKSKPLKKPVQLNIIKHKNGSVSEMDIVLTDSTGRFELHPAQLLNEPGKNIQLSINNPQRELYSITIADAYKELNVKLARSLMLKNYNVKLFNQSSETVVLKKEEGGNKLLDAKVVTKKDNNIYRSKPGPNACGDYVCLNGILNCVNHPFDGYEPVVGMRYAKRSFGSQDALSTLYEGCEALINQNKKEKEYMAALNGFYSTKVFYTPDYAKVDANDPQYISTIYWNYSVLTDEKGEAELNLFTNDIAGKYRIVMQGITTRSVVAGEHFFEVRKN